MTKSLLALLAGATMLAGCNLAPKYVRSANAVPAEVPQGGVYPAASTDAADVTAIGWRDFFVDPKLRDVIALGLENNRDLQLATANVLQARAQYRIQRADLLPTISANGSLTYTNNLFGAPAAAVPGTGTTPAASSSNIEIYSANVGVSQFELDLFGRVRNLSRAALEQYFATEEAQRAARVSLIAEIAAAYLTMASDQDQLVTARDTLDSFRQSLELTQAQFRIGVISELEVRQADTLYQAARNDIAAIQTRIAQDQNALNLLVGTTVARDLLPTTLTTHTIPTLPANLASTVLLRRPDVLQAEHQLIAQNANIGAARAALFPTISLTATLGTISTALSGLFGNNTENWTVNPAATLPIFDFGRRKGNVRYAEASQQAALATYEKTLQTAFREVADALATRGTIDEQVSARTARADSANVAVRLSDARYRSGVDSFLNTLDAQRTAYGARQDLVTTRLARANNLVELYRAFGGGLN
ncbi:efflux transporter outer membrane subunit [Sphingomonas sp. Leaf343]|uniref:efflux transporter outer membrane subunit n=1 Tax=Sphingomonas sp. Leaf343 TaxID=1736345 RepID=UPI000B15F0AB|nr:efflux transporter outer membrane subunit [Sphingomonas sp. Leaf343]